jgi:transcription-repair coupling factor (superfamily II helicase)
MNIRSYFPSSVHKTIFGTLTPKSPLVVSGISGASAKGYFVGDFLKDTDAQNIFWLVNDDKEVYDVHHNLVFWVDRQVVALDHLLSSNEQDDYRIPEVILGINEGGKKIYIISQKDLTFPVPTYAQIKEAGMVITKGQEIPTVEFFNKLMQIGYQPSVDIILKKGECHQCFPHKCTFPY